MKVDISTLPDDTIKLKQMLVDFQGHYDKETTILLEQINHLRAQLFGRKSEKIKCDNDAQPLFLFDMPEPEVIEEEDEVHIPAYNRKKRGRKPLPRELPRVEIIHDIDECEKVCGCGNELNRIGEEVSEQLDIIPAKVRVLRHIRPKYACNRCEGVEDDGSPVRVAPVSPQIIPKSIASPGLLAHIMTGKFIDHTPFYRQEKQFLRLGVEISRGSMCNWAMKAATACRPLLNLLQDEVISGSYINIDETT
ncbi:MAG: transposase, partial [Desulfobacteraceae bacterium]|nr:transposase [Desulfobacteraceae bacterium]